MRKAILAITSVLLLSEAANAADCSFELRGKPLPRAVAVDRAGVVLEWHLIEGYPEYKVELSTDPDFASTLSLKPPKKECECPPPPAAPSVTIAGDSTKAATASYKVVLADDEELRTNTRYYWRVTALGGTGNCPQQISDVRRFRTAREIKEIFSPGKGWSLAQGIEGKAIKEPAKFAWARSLDDDTGENDDSYTARFGLRYEGETRTIGTGGQDIAFTTGLFGVLNDHNDAADTALGIASGITHVVPFGGEGSGMSNEYKLKFEGDQDFDTRKAFAEGTFTFASGNPNLHMGLAPETSGPIRWMWEPTIIAAYGRTIDRGASTETDDTVLRVGAKIDVDIRLQAISEMLNAPTSITLSDIGYYLPNEEDQQYRNLVSAALDVQVADGFTIGFEFNHGAEAPEFERTHSLGLTIGVKF